MVASSTEQKIFLSKHKRLHVARNHEKRTWIEIWEDTFLRTDNGHGREATPRSTGVPKPLGEKLQK
jgi:hypothetical protein